MAFVKQGSDYLKSYNLSIIEKIKKFNYVFLAFVCSIVFMGLIVLYSASNGNFSPWADKQFARFLLSLGVLCVIALSNVRFWLKYAYVIYIGALMLLLGVALFGHVGMGAQRWLDLGVLHVQPSEIMKIALVLALARYFHGSTLSDIRSIRYIIMPLLLMIIPVALILEQPDLGTALILVFITGGIFFIVGVQIWKFLAVLLGACGIMPIIWSFLHAYQQQRVLTFLNPQSDPLGAGYHIIQSKIALGSGGLFGKGFMQSTQSRLSFLPEKQTDFIFTLFAEEFGFMGSILLITLFLIVIGYGFYIGLKANHFFGKILAIGLSINFTLYLFINIAMVTGLLPVVGVPLPLMSYGGTAMMTLFIGFGLIELIYINKDLIISKSGSTEG